MDKPGGQENSHDIEWDREGRILADDPNIALTLPDGLLAIQGLPLPLHGAAAYPVTERRVLEAAEYIIARRAPEQESIVFHNRAEVMAFASREFGWHTGKELEFVAVGNYMQVPHRDEAAKEAKAEELDCMIDILKSGLLTTREGSRKLFPQMSDEEFEGMWTRHEERIEEAVAEQERSMDGILAKLRAEKAARGGAQETASRETRWTDRAKTPQGRTNPCLEM